MAVPIELRAPQGCRTCKRRKIGCDKQLPVCRNCVRTGRQCMGYGIKLRWPDEHDGRRKDGHVQLPADAVFVPHEPTELYGQQFLNVSTNDLILASRPISQQQLTFTASCMDMPTPRSLSPWPDIAGDTSELLQYYEARISRMISTIDTQNGFRTELLPRALSQSHEASTALRNAILAVSCFHRFGVRAALPFKTKALRFLSQSLAGEGALENPAIAESQIAASMMLCVYSVFDETEGNWALHLNGARHILRQLANAKNGVAMSSFLFTWFLYHEVLGGSSQYRSRLSDGSPSISDFLPPNFDKTEIIGSLGCSLEVLDAIHRINFLRDNLPSRIYTTEFEHLEYQLVHLNQHLGLRGPNGQVQIQVSGILGTAEFYRIAALIYLKRIIPGPDSASLRNLYVEQAFQILGSLPICTSPWPLFVLACEAQSDDQRIRILSTLDQMDQNRKIGNVFVIRKLIEAYWNRRDLQADVDAGLDLNWWDMAALNSNMPWFI